MVSFSKSQLELKHPQLKSTKIRLESQLEEILVNGYIGDIDKVNGYPFDAFVSFNYLNIYQNPELLLRIYIII